MYKYMCVVSDSADKQVYYDTVAELKKRYPDCCEDTTARFGKGTMGQVLNIPESNATPKVCVMIDEENSQVVVLSETYLCSFFDGKNVEGVRKYSLNHFSYVKGDIMFFVINFIAGIVSFDILGDFAFAPLVVIIASAVIHTILSIFIQRKIDISNARLFLMQIGGGWGTLVVIVAALIFAFVTGGWGGVIAILYLICYASAIIPALILSAIVRFIYNCIKSD